MARYITLNSHAGCFCLAVGGLGLMACFSTSLRAQQPATTPMGPPPQAASASAKAPATNAAPVVPPETLGRYGKIVVPSDDVAHPLKLKMPFPDVGEIKIPTQDELGMRATLEPLSKLSDSEIRVRLEQWPPYTKMTLRDEGAMLQRIQDFRDYRTRVAAQKARDMGLVALTPDQKVHFEKLYWDKHLQMERDLAKQFEPILTAREQQLQNELFREFSPPLAQAPMPPPAPSPTNQAPQAPAPVTQNKTALSNPSSPAAATNVTQPAQPVAQAPR